MIHPVDFDAMEKLFRGAEIPEALQQEYETQQRMTRAWGNSGPLGMNLIIPMMRLLGYGKIVEQALENVDWRNHIGEEVSVLYADSLVRGKLIDLGNNSRLTVQLERFGVVDVPRYCVKAKPLEEIHPERNDWVDVKPGTKVVVHGKEGDLNGKLEGAQGQSVRVKVGRESLVCPVDSVELVA